MTVSSTRPTPRRSPFFSTARAVRVPLTKVPLVLSRSTTSSSVAPAVSRQCRRDTSAASTMKSARVARPTVLMLPGRIRNVNGNSAPSAVLSTHTQQLLDPGMHDLAAARQQRLPGDLVAGIRLVRRLLPAVLAEQVREERRDV